MGGEVAKLSPCASRVGGEATTMSVDGMPQYFLPVKASSDSIYQF